MESTRFILIHTSHAGNVGATARAMKVMGFHDLVLVAPRFADVLCHEEAVAMASGAADILARARVVPTLAEALDGVDFACATAMTPRDFGPPTREPRALFAELAARAAAPRLALVFGSERYGMSNEDVYRCHAVLSIPTHPDYGSLNLAQASSCWSRTCARPAAASACSRARPTPSAPTPARCRGCWTTCRPR